MMKGSFLAACLLAASPLAGASVPAMAQDASGADDIMNKIINVPSPAAYRVDGIKNPPKPRKDDTVQGGQALRVQVPGKGANTWSVAVANPINKPVKAGDNIIIAFWAKLAKGENGATSASLPYNALQLASAPYSAIFNGPATIGPEWKLHEVKGKVDKDYAAGALNVSLHLATGKQTIDLGPIFVLNMGQGKS